MSFLCMGGPPLVFLKGHNNEMGFLIFYINWFGILRSLIQFLQPFRFWIQIFVIKNQIPVINDAGLPPHSLGSWGSRSTHTEKTSYTCTDFLAQSGRVLSFFSSLSSELGLPQPLTCRRVCPLWYRGPAWGRTLAGERGGGRVPIPMRGHTLWYTAHLCTLCFLVILFL
jgi:hypothetical protein